MKTWKILCGESSVRNCNYSICQTDDTARKVGNADHKLIINSRNQ
ncbi:hypothetical protein QUF80_20770 [Desulfococcaceae bacterium HSG8]|nr:hypothetical protein [Desulfococcaceae bacterium HSG8]